MTLKHSNKAFLLSLFLMLSGPQPDYWSHLLCSVTLEPKCASDCHHIIIPFQNPSTTNTSTQYTQLTTFHDQIAWISHYQPPNIFTYSLGRFMSHCFEPTQGYWSTSNTKKNTANQTFTQIRHLLRNTLILIWMSIICPNRSALKVKLSSDTNKTKSKHTCHPHN